RGVPPLLIWYCMKVVDAPVVPLILQGKHVTTMGFVALGSVMTRRKTDIGPTWSFVRLIAASSGSSEGLPFAGLVPSAFAFRSDDFFTVTPPSARDEGARVPAWPASYSVA